MTAFLALTGFEFAALCGIAFLAGVVRGFSGFALSAIVMATAVLILPPVALIPICWMLEMAASVLMAKGGIKEADRRVVTGLIIGTIVGVPIGLSLTTSLPVDTSKMIALVLIVTLAILQLAKVRIAFLATQAGLYTAGLLAGIATGLASVGGMVVALYVLSQDTVATKMRAALVTYLFVSSLFSLMHLLWFGIMDSTAALRGLALVAPTMIGVFVGQQLFTPRLATYYKPFCLALLTGLACLSLVRLTLS